MLKVEHEHEDFAEIGPDTKKWKSGSVLNDTIRNHSIFFVVVSVQVWCNTMISEAACSDLFESWCPSLNLAYVQFKGRTSTGHGNMSDLALDV